MSFPNIGGDELLSWVEDTSACWRKLMGERPDALHLPCDIRETQTVGELLQHIVAVELRYAERLNGYKATNYEDIPFSSPEEIYAVHDRAIGFLSRLQDEDEIFWAEPMVFRTRSAGEIRATRKIIFIHLLMHSVRHYAQLATLMRRNGIKPDWEMDYLFTQARTQVDRVEPRSTT